MCQNSTYFFNHLISPPIWETLSLNGFLFAFVSLISFVFYTCPNDFTDFLETLKFSKFAICRTHYKMILNLMVKRWNEKGIYSICTKISSFNGVCSIQITVRQWLTHKKKTKVLFCVVQLEQHADFCRNWVWHLDWHPQWWIFKSRLSHRWKSDALYEAHTECERLQQ